MKKWSLLLLIVVFSILTACSNKSENEPINETEVVETEQQTTELEETTSNDSQSEDSKSEEPVIEDELIKMTPSEQFAHEYLSALFEGEIDFENTYLPVTVSIESFEQYIKEWQGKLTFSDFKMSISNGFLVSDGEVISYSPQPEKRRKVFAYELLEDKVYIPEFFVQDVQIGLNKNAEFIINGIHSKDINPEFDSFATGSLGLTTPAFLIPKTLRVTDIVVEQDILEDAVFHGDVHNGSYIGPKDFTTNLDIIDQDALKEFIERTMQEIINAYTSGGTKEDVKHLFEEGTSDNVLTKITNWNNEASDGGPYRYEIKEIKSIDFSYKDTVKVIVEASLIYKHYQGRTEFDQTGTSMIWVQLNSVDDFIIDKAQHPDYLFD